MITKTFNEILEKEFNLEENYSITSGDIDDIKPWVLKLMKQVRKATLQECARKTQIKEDWWQDNGHPEGFSYTIVDKDSILNLDLNSIEVDD